MISKIFNNYMNDKKHFETVYAHCDIPCKIYDPMVAQIAVLTMIRLVDLINELEKSNTSSINDKAQFSRLISQKEDQGIIVTHSIMIKCSQTKQKVDRACAIDLLASVNRFAEIFWATKNIKTFKANCPYPPELELIYPDLN